MFSYLCLSLSTHPNLRGSTNISDKYFWISFPVPPPLNVLVVDVALDSWFCSHKYDFYCGALAAFCLYSDRSLTRNYLRRLFLVQNKIDKFPMRFCWFVFAAAAVFCCCSCCCYYCFASFVCYAFIISHWHLDLYGYGYSRLHIYICIYIICVRLGDFNIYRLSDLQQEFAEIFLGTIK